MLTKIRIVGLSAATALILSGCVSAPSSVGEYSYDYLETIGAIDADESCKKLRDNHASEGKMAKTQVENAVASCKKTAQNQQYRYEYEKRQAEQKVRNAEIEQERIAKAEDIEAHKKEIEALEERRSEAFQESRQVIKKRINETSVAGQLGPDLDDALVNNQMQVDGGVPLPELKRVLACSEMRFDARKIDVNRSGKELSVLFKDAMTSSGRIDITMNFVENPDFWLMTDYKVGIWSSSSAIEKGQLIVQSNTAPQCNALDVMETLMKEDD